MKEPDLPSQPGDWCRPTKTASEIAPFPSQDFNGMSTPNTPPEGVTLMDLLPGFTLIATPVAGLFGSRHHGLSGIGLGLACGTVIGAAGFFMSKGLISTIEAVCARCSSESEDSEEDCGCALQVAILGLLLLLTAIAPCSTVFASNLVPWLSRCRGNF